MNLGNNAATQAMTQLGGTGQTPEQINATINRLIDQQAYTMAVTDVFYMSAVLFVALIALVWFAKPKTAPGAAADAGGAH